MSEYAMHPATLADLLKDSAYKLGQFKPAQISALEAAITIRDAAKKPAPYVTCLVRGKSIKLTPEVQMEVRKAVIQSFSQKQHATRLLDAAQRAVEIAIEQDEAAAMAYLAREAGADA